MKLIPMLPRLLKATSEWAVVFSRCIHSPRLKCDRSKLTEEDIEAHLDSSSP